MIPAPGGGDTIYALSSGAPPAAIAIVRVSGARAADAAIAIAGPLPTPRRATVRALRDGAGETIDKGLMLWFPGERTATGEDMVEFHVHGGRAVVVALMAALAALPGLRMAEAGEFTRRALLNGRIDLVQAEGLADLLAAETEAARRQALHAAEGGLSGRIAMWRDRLLLLSARSEALLAFGDDEGDVLPDPRLGEDIAAFAETLCEALRMPPAERLREGFRVLVAGPPNAGKSSLINALADRAVSIVTDVAGTTRDLVEVPISLGGQALLLIDSAGLHDSKDVVERIGIDRARAALNHADLVLWLGDAADRPEARGVIALHARADQPGRDMPPADVELAVSVVDGRGLDRLRSLLVSRAGDALGDVRWAMGARQRACIAAVVDELGRAAARVDEEVRAEHLRMARVEIDRLIGAAGIEEVLDSLFSRFCIGK